MGVSDSLVWLEGVTRGSPSYSTYLNVSNSGCSLWPHVSVGAVGASLTLENYLYSPEAYRVTLLDGEGLGQVLYADTAGITVRVSGLTMQRGSSNSLYFRNARLLLEDSTVISTTAHYAVYLYDSDGGLNVRELIPVSPQGVPLMDARAVRSELLRAADLLARGDSWGHNTHTVHNTVGQRSRVVFEALRDRLVEAGMLYPPRQGASLEWTEAGLRTIKAAQNDELCLSLFSGPLEQSQRQGRSGGGEQ